MSIKVREKKKRKKRHYAGKPQLNQLVSINDAGKISLAFHRGQTKAWDSRKRFVFVIAGSQSGKTSWAPWWLHEEIRNTWTPGPGNDYLAVTSTFDLFKIKFLPEMQRVFCDILDIGHFWAADRVIELRCMDENDSRYGRFWAKKASDTMWGRIILRSAQSKGGLEAATAKAAVLDECGQDEFSLEAWEAVQRRLSIAQGRVLGTTTPYNLGWLYSNIYVPWREGNPDIEVIQFSSTMNPSFPQDEYDRAKQVLPSWRFAMFYDGRFERPAGLIYRCVTDKTYIDPFPIPRSWDRVVGVDFGGANTALVWLARDPETDRWILYDCTLEGYKSTVQHVMSARQKSLGLSVKAFGGARSEGQHRMDWSSEGFPIFEPLTFDLEAGIARVVGLVNSDKLRIFNDLDGLKDEIGTYRRKLDENNNPTEDIIAKRNFHRLDALRYAATYLQGGSDTQIMGYSHYMEKYHERQYA